MLPVPRLTLLDLDGTLVDSVPDLAASVNAMLAQLDRPACTEDEVRRWVGNGVDRLLQRALTGTLDGIPEASLFARAKPVFERVYSTINGRYSQLYPGVIEGLESLRQLGSTLACITNKPALFTQPLLHTLGLSHFFSLTLSGDSLARKKPDPLPLLHAASTFGVRPEQCLMIGDSRHDVDAARAAGIAVIAVSYGYNHGQPITLARPDGIVDSLLELPRYFEV